MLNEEIDLSSNLKIYVMKTVSMFLSTLLIACTLMGLSYYTSPSSHFTQSTCSKTFKSIHPFQTSFSMGVESKKIAHIFQGLAPRFKAINKSDLRAAFSVRTFLSEEQLNSINQINSSKLKLITDDTIYTEGLSNQGEMMSKDQLSQLNNMPYSSNFVVEVMTNGYHSFTPHFTLVPEVQAEYKLGLGAMFEYLRLNSQAEINQLDEDELGPGRLYITIGKDGKIIDLKLWSSSRDTAFDKRVVELMRSLPGEWEAAEDADGNKVEQELVLFFGIMGC
jgi:hypothetical protein